MSTESDSESRISMDDNKEADSGHKKNAGFSNTISMFATLLGYSIGISDTWRFPFLAYRNGGGAFLIPFVFTIVICGIPMYFLEYSIGNFSGKGPFGVWDVSPLFRGAGISIIVGYFLFMVGQSVFRGWLAMFLIDCFQERLPWTHCNNSWNTDSCRTTSYLVLRIEGSRLSTNVTGNVTGNDTRLGENSTTITSTGDKPMTSAEEYWQYEALHLSTGLSDFGPILWSHILVILILRVIVFLACIKSIKSIEKVMYVLTLAPILFLFVIIIKSLTLPGAVDGLYEFFYPDFAKLRDPKIWIEAFLMAFYTLAFGWGVITSLGSHSSFKDNCVRTSILLPILDSIFSISNGAASFMVLGNMAHMYGIKVYDVINAGMSTGVVSFVSALSTLPGPHFWTFAYIFTSIVTGLDSQIVPFEMILQVIGEIFPTLFPKYRIHLLMGLSILMFVLSLPTCTGAGVYIFLWMDWYSGTWIGPIVAVVELVAVGWCYGMDRFSMDIALMTGRPAPWFFRVFIVFVAPPIVVGIFLTACIKYVPPKYGSYTYPDWARGLGWLLVLVTMSPLIIKAVHVMLQHKGSVWKRLKESIKAAPTWRPKELEAREAFMSQRALYKNRSLKDMLHYTLFGSYMDETDMAYKRELSVLVK